MLTRRDAAHEQGLAAIRGLILAPRPTI